MKVYNKDVFILQKTIRLAQMNDCEQETDGDQILKIERGDCGAGGFIILETKRWSIDSKDIDAFCELLKEFAKE